MFDKILKLFKKNKKNMRDFYSDMLTDSIKEYRNLSSEGGVSHTCEALERIRYAAGCCANSIRDDFNRLILQPIKEKNEQEKPYNKARSKRNKATKRQSRRKASAKRR